MGMTPPWLPCPFSYSPEHTHHIVKTPGFPMPQLWGKPPIIGLLLGINFRLSRKSFQNMKQKAYLGG
jgi:hypothetical protein